MLLVPFGYFDNIPIDEQRLVGENGSQAIEAAERLIRLVEQALEGVQTYRRIRWKRRRHKRPDSLVAVGLDDVAA
ncbi:MAG: hypothetical protein EXQ52_00425 [Bryobacterales bacterium]|nr:hypothetical protein [Bryobacterales bacterium]